MQVWVLEVVYVGGGECIVQYYVFIGIFGVMVLVLVVGNVYCWCICLVQVCGSGFYCCGVCGVFGQFWFEVCGFVQWDWEYGVYVVDDIGCQDYWDVQVVFFQCYLLDVVVGFYVYVVEQ